jgi:hypothetical protein
MSDPSENFKTRKIYGSIFLTSKMHLVLMIIIFSISLIVGITKATSANGTSTDLKIGVFFQYFAIIFIPSAAILMSIVNIVPGVREGFSEALGRTPSAVYQIDESFFMLAMAIGTIVAYTKFTYSAEFCVALVFSIFGILSGSSRIFEFYNGNNSLDNISLMFWDLIPSLTMIVTGSIGSDSFS